MTETLHPVEPIAETERRKQLAVVERYVMHGDELTHAALEFFDRDTATLMHFLDYLGQKLNIGERTSQNPDYDIQTPAGRLLDLRDLYTPPRR